MEPADIAWGGIYLLLAAFGTSELITVICVVAAPSLAVIGGWMSVAFGVAFVLWLAGWSMQ